MSDTDPKPIEDTQSETPPKVPAPVVVLQFAKVASAAVSIAKAAVEAHKTLGLSGGELQHAWEAAERLVEGSLLRHEDEQKNGGLASLSAYVAQHAGFKPDTNDARIGVA